MGTNALRLSGAGYASTPDIAALDITGDLDIRAAVAMDAWVPSAQQYLAAKWLPGQQSYELDISPGGQIHLGWDTDGSGASVADQSAGTGFAAGALHGIRAVLQINTGGGARTTTFYTKTTIRGTAYADCQANTGWTVLTTVSGNIATSVFAGTADLLVGALNTTPFGGVQGVVYAVVIKNGVNGTAVADPDFTSVPVGVTSFTDAAGRVWTLHGDATVIDTAPSAVVTTKPYVRTRNLGSDDWAVRISTRGGGSTLVEAPAQPPQMQRQRNEVSTTSITVPVTGLPSSRLGALAAARPWVHEIELWRGPDLAWVGPIADKLRYTFDGIQISARDWFSIFERRNLTTSEYENLDVSEIFAGYFADALRRDPSPNLDIDVQRCNVVQTRSFKTEEYRRAADEMRNLGDFCNWSMVGRTLRVRPSDEGVSSGAAVGSEIAGHLYGVAVGKDTYAEMDGLSLGSEWTVTGSVGGAVAATVGGVDHDLGLLQTVAPKQDVTTADDALVAAKKLEASNDENVVVNMRLAPTSAVRFSDLIPGRIFDVGLDLGWVEVAEVMRLDMLTVAAAGSDDSIVAQLVRIPDLERPVRPSLSHTDRWRL